MPPPPCMPCSSGPSEPSPRPRRGRGSAQAWLWAVRAVQTRRGGAAECMNAARRTAGNRNPGAWHARTAHWPARIGWLVQRAGPRQNRPGHAMHRERSSSAAALLKRRSELPARRGPVPGARWLRGMRARRARRGRRSAPLPHAHEAHDARCSQLAANPNAGKLVRWAGWAERRIAGLQAHGSAGRRAGVGRASSRQGQGSVRGGAHGCTLRTSCAASAASEARRETGDGR